MKKKFKIIRIVVGLVAALVWYICSTKGGKAVVQEVAGLLAVLCLFGKLIWKFLFHPKSDDKASSPSTNSSSKSNQILIEPYFPDTKRTWVWDGKELRPYFPDTQRTWVWDGKELRPYIPDTTRTWVWNGKELRPYIIDTTRTWVWNGKELRPYIPDTTKTWVYNGKLLRPYIPDTKRSWKTSGDVPIPVLAKAAGII